jgi:hypothetical protein
MNDTATSSVRAGAWRCFLQAGLPTAVCLTAAAGGPAPDHGPAPSGPGSLTLLDCSRAGGCTTLDFATPEPAGRHQLEDTQGLRRIMSELERRRPRQGHVRAGEGTGGSGEALT